MATVAKQPVRTSPAKPSGAKRAASKTSSTPRRASTRPAPRVASGTLPGWGEIGMTAVPVRDSRMERLSARLPAQRFYLGLLVLLCAVVGYVGHVYATKQLYRSVQTLSAQNLQLHLKHNRLRGELDAATAPSVVVGRARALGLEEGMAYGPTIPLAPTP